MDKAVVVHIRLSDDDLGTTEDDLLIEALEESVRTALQTTSVGEWDGHEFGGGWARVFCYGPCADALFEVIAHALLGNVLPGGSFVVKRYGRPGAPQQIIGLSNGTA